MTLPAPPAKLPACTVLLFAHPRELAGGAASVLLELAPGASVADARAALARAHPALAPALATARLAAGDALVDAANERDTPCPAELALIPPVSGG